MLKGESLVISTGSNRLSPSLSTIYQKVIHWLNGDNLMLSISYNFPLLVITVFLSNLKFLPISCPTDGIWSITSGPTL